MVEFYKQFYFMKVYECWFAYKYKLTDIFLLKAYLHIKSFNKKRPPGIFRKSYTIENSLESDVNDIFSGFSSSTKNEIRKGERADIICYFHDDVDGFVTYYNSFARKKRIPEVSSERLEALGSSLKLSYALLDGRVLVAHSYITDQEEGIVRLYQSASSRLGRKEDNYIGAIANKYLHFKDIKYFKEQGFKTYDWGGYAKNTDDRALKGINDFKLKFGGRVVDCLNYYSIGYVLCHKVANIFGFLGKR